MADLRLPNLTATNTDGRLKQLESYLYQLTNQLNFALKSVEGIETSKGYHLHPMQKSGSPNSSLQEHDTFYTAKDLIVKSADIVEAYADEISKRLEGKYVASSKFGKYTKETEALIKATSENITQNYYSKQEIDSTVENITSGFRENGCYVKTGWLNDNNTIAGIEIGKYSVEKDENGEEIMSDVSFAQFRTDRLCWRDSNGTEVAWLDVTDGNQMLHIQNATIVDKLRHGGYLIDSSHGLTWTWVGKGDN